MILPEMIILTGVSCYLKTMVGNFFIQELRECGGRGGVSVVEGQGEVERWGGGVSVVERGGGLRSSLKSEFEKSVALSTLAKNSQNFLFLILFIFLAQTFRRMNILCAVLSQASFFS